MSADDPYRTPEAELTPATDGAGSTPGRARDDFFDVGALKLGLLSICTLGIYDLYWFYRNWRAIQRRSGLTISPFWRAFFGPFWGWSIASRINGHALEIGVNPFVSHLLFGTSYFLLFLTWRLPDPFWLISMLAFLPILGLQRTVKRINEVQGTSDRSLYRFSVWNWIGVMLGGPIFLLALIGTVVPAG